ncbi:MAG TPA: hypothetical protein VN633_01435 [Bryobacteraceae bacterium]|nr:hypothetical protein [Bryobacteraceae bacterium]
MDISGFFSVFMRFLHIACVAGLIGGALYAKWAMEPALNALPEAERGQAAKTTQLKFRGILYTILVLLVISGIYNGFGPGTHQHSTQWQIWFGIKMLLVLHILSTAILWVTSPYGDIAVGGKGKRRLAQLVVIGFITIFIGTYLHYLTSLGL